MTDEEIMKNTRCCADNYCKNCSLQGKPNCKNMLLSFAWDTMYNQKAEIERLWEECDGWRNTAYHEASNVKYIANKTIKEFLNRLIGQSYKNDIYGRDGRPVQAVTIEDIISITKEMVGDTE